MELLLKPQQEEQCLTISHLNLNKNQSDLFPNIQELLTNDSRIYFFGQGSNANIRSFSVVLLKIIQKQSQRKISKNNGKDLPILHQFKRLLYRQSTILTCIKNIPKFRVQNKQKNGITLTTIETKKLIGQFLKQLVTESEDKNKVENLLYKYSSAHILFDIFMRSLLWLHFDTPNSIDYNAKIQDRDVFLNLGNLFGIQNVNVYEGVVSLRNYLINVYRLTNLQNGSQKNEMSWIVQYIYFIREKIEEQTSFARIKTLSKIVQIGQKDQYDIIPQIQMKKCSSFSEEEEVNLHKVTKKQTKNVSKVPKSIQETLQSDRDYIK